MNNSCEEIVDLRTASLTHVKRLNRVTTELKEVLNAFTYSIPYIVGRDVEESSSANLVYSVLMKKYTVLLEELKETMFLIADDLSKFNDLMNGPLE